MSAITPEKLRDLLNETVPSADWSNLGIDDSLEDGGLDSLDKATFFMKIEEQTGNSIPDEAYEEIDSITSLIAYLAKQ